jgi:hypothetical protein
MSRRITEANVRNLTKEDFEHLCIGIDPIFDNNIITLIDKCYNNVRMAARLDLHGIYGSKIKGVGFVFLDRCFYKNLKHTNSHSYGYMANKIYTDKVGYRKVVALAFSDHKAHIHKAHVSWGYVPDDNESIIIDIIE